MKNSFVKDNIKIPLNWDFEKLGKMVEIKYGKSQKDVEEKSGKYKILGTGGVIGKTNSYLWNQPSVLIGRKGTIDKPIYIEEPFWTVDTLFYTKINKETFPKWLYYYLNHINLKKYNEATGVPSLGVSILNNINILKPPLPEQQKIASILSTVDQHIEETDALIEKTKELKKGLMQKLLTKGIGHTEFKKTEVGEIPVEWEVKKLGNIFHTITDFVANGSFASLRENVKYKEQEDYAILIRLFDYKNEYKGPFVYVNSQAYEFLNKSKLKSNDIIISNVGAYAGLIYRTINLYKPMTLGPNSILVRSNECEDYLFYWLNSKSGQKQLKNITTITAQPKFNKTDFKTLLCPIPSIKEQQKIASILLQLDKHIEEYKKVKEKSNKLKKGLMQQLLTGKKRVI